MEKPEISSVRIMLVDDHEVVRTGLRTYLETQEGMEVVAEAENGSVALLLAASARPDVIVMDISMNGMDGLEATRRLSVICPEAKILALTIHDDRQFFLEMLAAGAVGYVTKQVAADELVIAIHSVSDGEAYLQPSLVKWLLDEYRKLLSTVKTQLTPAQFSDGHNENRSSLSKREIQVLELVANGKTNPEISGELGISPKTVSRHRERIMRKLNVHSTTELLKFAIRTGLISFKDL